MNPQAATQIGGPQTSFPTTSWSILRQGSALDPEDRRKALERLARLYWKPVYAYLRRRWRLKNEDAKDLTQAFFTRLWEKAALTSLPDDLTSFRRYVCAALNNFVRDAYDRDHAQRRGGAFDHISLEDLTLEDPSLSDPEVLFDREWVRSLLDRSIRRLREELDLSSRPHLLTVFEAYDLASETERPTYAQLAGSIGVRETDVLNYLHAARQRLRRILEEELQETVLTSGALSAEWEWLRSQAKGDAAK